MAAADAEAGVEAARILAGGLRDFGVEAAAILADGLRDSMRILMGHGPRQAGRCDAAEAQADAAEVQPADAAEVSQADAAEVQPADAAEAQAEGGLLRRRLQGIPWQTQSKTQ